jgi:hypothetical protein
MRPTSEMVKLDDMELLASLLAILITHFGEEDGPVFLQLLGILVCRKVKQGKAIK